MRGREFLMKDMYRFSSNQADHDEFYHQVEDAYKRIYELIKFLSLTQASFTDADKIIFERRNIFWPNKPLLNEEVLIPEVLEELGVKREELESARAAEVGNIFTLKDKYSAPLNLEFRKLGLTICQSLVADHDAIWNTYEFRIGKFLTSRIL